MTMVFRCAICNNAYVVSGLKEETTRLLECKEEFSCITPFCSGLLKRVNWPLVGDKVTTLPLNQFFRAVNGFGLAKGDPASASKVRDLLVTKRISSVVVEPVGDPERTIIKYVVLEDGTRLHFTASSKGACVYYVEEQGPTCTEVFDARNAVERGPESSFENRKEVGRAIEGSKDDRSQNTATEIGLHRPDLPALQSGSSVQVTDIRHEGPSNSTGLRMSNTDEADQRSDLEGVML